MARLDVTLPKEVMDDMKKIGANTKQIFGEMTKAGAEVAYHNIVANVPDGIRNSGMMSNLKMSKVYETPSDDGINTKVLFAGYFINDEGVKTPAPLVANVFEYGRSGSKFPKQPFLRKSFAPNQLKRAMLEAQKKASGGLLDE